MFPEGKTDGLYHTADATLWFFHALNRYLEYAKDDTPSEALAASSSRYCGPSPARHATSTFTSIAEDGLLVQGQEGYQLTWMDAKVDDWVVTPRRGKAVEINALWYNALRLLEKWLRESGRDDEAGGIAEHAAKSAGIFQSAILVRGGRLSVRRGRWRERTATIPLAARIRYSRFRSNIRCSINRAGTGAVQVVKDRLLTPVGLRSLAPGEKDYKPKYDGDLRSRDAAYHQGTVWAWLIGPFIDAWLKVHPDDFQRRAVSSKGSSRICARRASGRSARFSMPNRPSRRAVAARRPGASPRCCAAS